MPPAMQRAGMSADAPRLGYALWDLLHALTTAVVLGLPLIVVAAAGYLAYKSRQ